LNLDLDFEHCSFGVQAHQQIEVEAFQRRVRKLPELARKNSKRCTTHDTGCLKKAFVFGKAVFRKTKSFKDDTPEAFLLITTSIMKTPCYYVISRAFQFVSKAVFYHRV